VEEDFFDKNMSKLEVFLGKPFLEPSKHACSGTNNTIEIGRCRLSIDSGMLENTTAIYAACTL